MTVEMLIQNHSGTTKDYAIICDEIVVTTVRSGTAGKLTASMRNMKLNEFDEGSRLRLSVNGSTVFFGFVFKRKMARDGNLNIVAYDQLRYLKAKESYLFEGASVGDIIKQIANDLTLTPGTIIDTGYNIPYLLQENKTCFDMITRAMQLTTLNTGQIYTFYDDGGALALNECKNLISTIKFGDNSLVTDYEYMSDIDSDTYNQIKLVRPNEETGKTDVYIYLDSTNIAKWGLLQYYEQVDEELNPAQIEEQGKTMLLYYNRELQTIKLDTINADETVNLRAGYMVMIQIEAINISKFVILEKVTHKFVQGDHTMSMEAKISYL